MSNFAIISVKNFLKTQNCFVEYICIAQGFSRGPLLIVKPKSKS